MAIITEAKTFKINDVPDLNIFGLTSCVGTKTTCCYNERGSNKR